jgi:hypothetical protein
MGLNDVTFMARTVKLYDIWKLKNALVKYMYYVMEYVICSFVPTTRIRHGQKLYRYLLDERLMTS